MKKFDIVIQPDAMDCGPACISMIAKYYGKQFSVEALRKSSFLGRNGVSLLGISKASESVGFKTIGGRISFDVLVEKALLPCIVHWEQDHFVVVYKIKKKRRGESILYIADPACGNVEYSESEFCKYWVSTSANGEGKGVVLLLEPTSSFYEQDEEKNTEGLSRFTFFWGYLLKYRYFFIRFYWVLCGNSLRFP